MSASQLKKFDSVQGFRGLAALGVLGVLYHLFIEKPLIRLFRQQFNRLGAK